MNSRHWIIFATLLALPAALTFLYMREFLAADSALDAGASYNYATGQADFTKNHPYIPFFVRHRTFLTISAFSMFGAVGYMLTVTISKLRKFATKPSLSSN